MNQTVLRQRAQEIADAAEIKSADFKAGQISQGEYKAFIERAHAETVEIQADLKAFGQARKMSSGTEVNLGVSEVAGVADFGRIVPPRRWT